MTVSSGRANPAFISLVAIGATLALIGTVVALVAGNNDSRSARVAELVGVPYESNPWPMILGTIVAVFGAGLLAAALIIRAARPADLSRDSTEGESVPDRNQSVSSPKRRNRLILIGSLLALGVITVIGAVFIVQSVQRAQAIATWHELTNQEYTVQDDDRVASFGATACAAMQSNSDNDQAAFEDWAANEGLNETAENREIFNASVEAFCRD